MCGPDGRTALYRVYDGQRILLYIGISDDFGSRWKAHGRNQPWWPDARHQTATWFDSRDEAVTAEAAAIKAEQPKYNIVHAGNTGITEAELLALPVSVDLVTAGRAFGVGRWKAHQLAKNGEFPCKVFLAGARYSVPRNAILEALGIDPAEATGRELQLAE
jgi:hypothetical protein